MQREIGKIVFRDLSSSKKSHNLQLSVKDSQIISQVPHPHSISTKRISSLDTASQSSLDNRKETAQGISNGIVVKSSQQIDHELTKRMKTFESLTFQEDSQVMDLECMVDNNGLKFVGCQAGFDESSCEISNIQRSSECEFASIKELQNYYQSFNADSLAIYENSASKKVHVLKKLSYLNEIYKDISRLKQEKINKRTLSNIQGIQHSLMQIQRQILRVC